MPAVRMEELSDQYETVAGRGNDRGLAAGGLFSFEGFPRQDQNQEYLIVAATPSPPIGPISDSTGAIGRSSLRMRFRRG